MSSSLSALLVDPALFTAPYDAALAGGLAEAGVRTVWAVRPLRNGERGALDPMQTRLIFYRSAVETVKGRGIVPKARKLLSHLAGGWQLGRVVQDENCDVVHLQWAVLPVYDALLMRQLARRRPVILTVHDLAPFNDAPSSRLQLLGFDQALRAADRLIVHTASARDTLIARGHAPGRVVQIPHGPLGLGITPLPHARPSQGRWQVVLFGKLQPYKGLDVLIEALGRLAPDVREGLRVIIAGEALMPLEPLVERARRNGLNKVVEFRPGRLEEAEMADLFATADAFVFPYRHIEASGVLHLVLPFRRWIIASDLGAFRELVVDGVNGTRVPVADPDALASALAGSVGQRPDPDYDLAVPSWGEIGARTRAVYEEVLAERRQRA